ncbi:MAG TPA: OstA-like protein, partial [Chitinophagaceae bacterium]|nr:OstA-like protein [Chitinophagaceae bacterium]
MIQFKKTTGLFLLTMLSSMLALSQVPLVNPKTTTTTSEDTMVTVEILPGVRKLEFRKLNDSTDLQILAGNVRLKQGNTFFFTDSCVINNNAKVFEAWGNVRINDADTATVTASHLRYLIDKKMAYFDGGVKLSDGKGSLTTPDLEYDVNTKIGIYKNGGTVINKKSILTSREGYYYTDLKDVYFKHNVVLKDPAYYITTDSLLYNTENETVRFIAETFIKDSSGRTIRTKEGYYNLKTGKAEFGQRPEVHDKNLYVTGNRIIMDDSTGQIQVQGNALVIDSANHTTILAGDIKTNKKTHAYLATRKPLMILKQDEDSIYISADTLFSARLTDLYGKKDSLTVDTLHGTHVMNVNEDDSTNRYFEAYPHVRIFSDSLQAVCDSMFYSFRDSVFRMFDEPVLWSKQSQITGDTVFLYTKNKKADRVNVIENSFLINRLDPEIYNQVKSTRMDGYFKEGNIDSVRARGFAECIYFIQDEDSAYSGINES